MTKTLVYLQELRFIILHSWWLWSELRTCTCAHTHTC